MAGAKLAVLANTLKLLAVSATTGLKILLMVLTTSATVPVSASVATKSTCDRYADTALAASASDTSTMTLVLPKDANGAWANADIPNT